MLSLQEETAQLLSPLPNLYSTDRLVVGEGDRDSQYLVFLRPEAGAVPSYAATYTFMQRFPDRRRLQYGSWEIGVEYGTRIIDAVWPKAQLDFVDTAAKLKFLRNLAKEKVYSVAAERAAKWKTAKKTPKHDYGLNPDKPLNSYQQVVLANSMSSDYLFFGDMGTGKTPTSVAVICNDCKRKRTKHRLIESDHWHRLHDVSPNPIHISLVVCPNQVRLNWREEIDRFKTEKLHVQIIEGCARGREKSFIRGLSQARCGPYHGVVFIMGWDTLAVTAEALSLIRWDVLVADELHYAKSQTTQRWKHLKKLRDNAAKRIGLTGDPISNTILDLYTQLEFLGEGQSGFSSFKAFKNFYGVYDTDFSDPQHGSKLVGIQNIPFIREQLARKAFLITKAEALPDLPKVTNRIVAVDMLPDQEALYNSLAAQMCVEIEEACDKAEAQGGRREQLTAQHLLVKLLRLAQITAGFYKTDDREDETGFVIAKGQVKYFRENPKIKALIEILEARDGLTKTIVWSCFVPLITQISEYLTTFGFGHVVYYGQTKKDEREIAVKQFNENPNCTVFVANPACAGEGLNLLGYDPHSKTEQFMDASQSIFVATNFSKTQRTQPEGRNHRIGTRRQCEIIDLVVAGTIDEEIRKRVMQKRITAYQISDVRAILKSISEMLV